MTASLCGERDPLSFSNCDELAEHGRIDHNGVKYDHFNHGDEHGWGNPEQVWEAELLAELPAHTYVETRSFRATSLRRLDGPAWTATWTTVKGGWSVYRSVAGYVIIRGNGVKIEVENPAIKDTVAVLRQYGALDDPAITGVSWEARRYLASLLDVYVAKCAVQLGNNGGATTHDEAHLNGLSAAVAWLRGELGTAPTPIRAAEQTDLLGAAWEVIAKAHGGQPWGGAEPAWRERALAWRRDYRRWQDNPSGAALAELHGRAWALIGGVEGGNWDDADLDWQKLANAFRDKYNAWAER